MINLIIMILLFIIVGCLIINIKFLKEMYEELLFVDNNLETIKENGLKTFLGFRIYMLKKHNIDISKAYEKYQEKLDDLINEEMEKDEDIHYTGNRIS